MANRKKREKVEYKKREVKDLNLNFYGAARTVTGSCYLVENGGTRFLVDCGMFQGSKEIKERNYTPFPFNPAEIDFVLLTHAHIDHSGMLPKLSKNGFKGKIWSTPATVDLARVMLVDSGHIQEMEVERKNKKNARAGRKLLEPVYTTRDAEACQRLFQSAEYENEFSPAPGIRVVLHEAGHILGSSMIEICMREADREVKILFSGDIGNPGQSIVRDPWNVEEVDFVVMESTYGNRLHKEHKNRLDLLRKIVKTTRQQGGNLVIPAFAVERTQDLLLAFNTLVAEGSLKPQDIYVDSPLAIQSTEIFCKYLNYFDNDETDLVTQPGACPLYLPGLKMSRTREDSMAINNLQGGAIIISASGMCDAGRIKHHLKHNLWRKEATVLLAGYQAQGTLGRRLLEGEKTVRIHGEEVAVKARIEFIDGFSAHADQRGLLDWIGGLRRPPARIYVTHGEENASLEFARLLLEEKGFQAEVPQWMEKVDLGTTGQLPLPEKKVEREYDDLEHEYLRVVEKINSLRELRQRQGKKGEFTAEILSLEAAVDGLLKDAND